MNTKRLIIGSLVGLVSLYIAGYLIWEVIFTEFFAANSGSATGVDRDPGLSGRSHWERSSMACC